MKLFYASQKYYAKIFLCIFVVFLCVCNLDAGKKAGTKKKTDMKKHVIPYKTNEKSYKNKTLPNAEANKTLEVVFTSEYYTQVVAQQGSMALLHCEVEDITNITVVWKKTGVMGELTKHNVTVAKDKRFIASNMEKENDWALHILYTQKSDEGLYECEVERNVSKAVFYKANLFVSLSLIKSHAQIIGVNPKRVKVGSPLRLSCLLKRSVERPAYIFWYKEDRVINYELEDGANVREGRQGSELIFPKAEINHSGNYSCVPSNADQASVIVEVYKN